MPTFGTSRWSLLALAALWLTAPARAADEPQINPFGDRTVGLRDDAVPGAVYLSNGTIIAGDVYLTRDANFRGFVQDEKEHRWVALTAVRTLTTVVLKEWDEKHWRWLENANDQKVYTGRTYPVRQYEYDLALSDGRTLRVGKMYSPVYVRYAPDKPPLRFILHDRQKGELDQKLQDLVYPTRIELGPDAKQRALEEQARRLKEAEAQKAGSQEPTTTAPAEQPTATQPAADDNG